MSFFLVFPVADVKVWCKVELLEQHNSQVFSK